MKTSCMALILLSLCAVVSANDKDVRTRTVANDLFIGGGSVHVVKPVAGDLIAAGGNVDVDAPIEGDAIAAGGNLRFNAPVGQNLYATGGRVVVDSSVGRNMRVAAGQVDITAKASIARNLTVGGGQVSVRGPVKGSVLVGGGRVLIDAVVDGDVSSTAGRISLGPNARIGGALRYRSGDVLDRDPAAQVAGAMEQMGMPVRMPGERSRAWEHHDNGWGWGGVGLWTIGLVALAAALLSAWPKVMQNVANTWRYCWGWSVLWGFVALLCLLAAAILLMVTVIGMPIGLMLMLAFAALLLVGYVASGIGLGLWLLARWRAPSAQHVGWRVGASALALLLLALLAAVPWVGAWVVLLAVLAGVGAIVQQWRGFPASASSAAY